MSENNNEINKEIESSNIFDDFSQDKNLVEEVNNLKKEDSKDKFYYISKVGHIFQTIFWISFFVFILLVSYIYIQNKEDLKNSNLLDPLCFVFLGDIYNDDSFCSSISSLNTSYVNKLSSAKKTQSEELLKILEDVYEIKNFTKTKEVIFLSDKSNNKLKVLTILEKFDNMKNGFEKIDKQKIQCKGLIIDSNRNTLSMSCTAYTAGYEKGIKGYDGETDSTIKGTSISLANSFLNFIAKKSDFFTIVDRQKVFKSENILGEKTDFTNKTTFNLKLKYNFN